MMWDLAGAEILPVGYESWRVLQADFARRGLAQSPMPSTRRSEMNSLEARDVARVLVENLIRGNHLSNVKEIQALREEAAESPDLFIEEILGCNQS
jgi:hypothetical protein